MQRWWALGLCSLLLACGGSHKKPARVDVAQDDRGSGGSDRGDHRQSDVTIHSNTTDDLSWLSAVYFEFDSSDLLPATRDTLVKLNEWLATHPKVALVIEGHCDEQGTTEYNIGLGQRRAQALVDYLARLGTSAGRLGAVSYGAERPVVDGHDEMAWSRNRRGEFRTSP